jgi:hypothetical protein
MNTKLRSSGIEGVGDMSWGTHFCMFYPTRDDLLDILIPYFKVGLENCPQWISMDHAGCDEQFPATIPA